MQELAALLQRRRRFLVFCLVGGSGVLVNLGVFSAVLLLWPGAEDLDAAGAGSLPTNVAGLLGWMVSVASNFILNDRFTFDDQIERIAGGWRRRIARYYVSAAVTLVLQLAVLNAVLWALTIGPLAQQAKALATGDGALTALVSLALTYVRAFSNLCGIAVGTVVNYAMSKRWVFK